MHASLSHTCHFSSPNPHPQTIQSTATMPEPRASAGDQMYRGALLTVETSWRWSPSFPGFVSMDRGSVFSHGPCSRKRVAPESFHAALYCVRSRAPGYDTRSGASLRDGPTVHAVGCTGAVSGRRRRRTRTNAPYGSLWHQKGTLFAVWSRL